MATIKLRGSQSTPLTIAEVDANFSNLNNDKYEKTGGTISGDVAITGALSLSTAATITAGSNAQGQSPLTNAINVVTTTSANPSGVTLPAPSAGVKITVINKGTNPVNVYPPTGDYIDSLAINTAISLPVNGVLTFYAAETTYWYSSSNEATNSSSLTNTNASGLNVLQTGLGTGFANMVVQSTVAAGQTWTVPANVKRFKVTVIGGGGGGGGTGTTAGQVGGGGGSAGAVIHFYDVVSGQTTGTFTVGAAGGAGAAGASGTAGGSSSFLYNSVTVTAGGGGLGVANGASGAGGANTGGTLSLPGSPGAYGGTQAATTVLTGMGADTPLGFGFGGLTTQAAAGSNGLSGIGFGSGGSGGSNGSGVTGRTGGAGRQGVVVIEY